MSSFQVAATNTEVLAASHLIEEMINYADMMEKFPVIIGDDIAYFHTIDGGYHRSGEYHIVNLTHTVQGPESPRDTTYSENVEAHLDGQYFFFTVEDSWSFGDYPNEPHILSLKVSDYQQGPYSFSEELQLDIDKRHQEHHWEK